MTEIIYVQVNGEKRKATQLELSQLQKDEAELKALADSIENKQAARESALAKLAALGLTEAEIAAL
jgi:hypothetical protein